MTPSETILCAGKSLPITHSLKCALRGIRSATESINVWADQLCINQSDVHERNDQVRAMDRVYARSGGIVAWLGADEEQIAEKAFGLLKDLYSRFFEGNDRKNATEISKLAELERDDVRTFETPEWFALAKLYHQPWFTRVWVAQEIGTDSPATVQWSSAKVDWKIVAEVSLILTTHTRRLSRHLKMPSHFASYLYKQFAGPPLGPEDFVRHLHYSRNRQATDLRDHVFAQTGHPSGRSPTTGLPIMKVDYSKSLPEVFKDATITLLEQCSALDVLNTVQHGPKLEYSEEWPSWVTHCNNDSIVHCLGLVNTVFRAAGTTNRQFDLGQKNTIQLGGLQMDIVEFASDAPLNGDPFGQYDQREQQLIKTLWDSISKNQPLSPDAEYVGGGDTLTAFLQALAGGCWYFSQRRDLVTSKLAEEYLDRAQRYHSQRSHVWREAAAAYITKLFPDLIWPNYRVDRCDEMAAAWADNTNSVAAGRKLMRTESGYFGLGPLCAKEGDIICVLFGGRTPYCLRQVNDRYMLLGECYVHGLMNGEAIGMMEQGQIEQKTFCLI